VTRESKTTKLILLDSLLQENLKIVSREIASKSVSIGFIERAAQI